MEETTCPWCGRTEPNELILNINHHPDSWVTLQTGWCIAMQLTLTHLANMSDVGKGLRPMPEGLNGRKTTDPTDEYDRELEAAQRAWVNRLPELEAAIIAGGIERPELTLF